MYRQVLRLCLQLSCVWRVSFCFLFNILYQQVFFVCLLILHSLIKGFFVCALHVPLTAFSQINEAHGTDVSVGFDCLGGETLLQEKNSAGRRWESNPGPCIQYGHCCKRAKPLRHLAVSYFSLLSSPLRIHNTRQKYLVEHPVGNFFVFFLLLITHLFIKLDLTVAFKCSLIKYKTFASCAPSTDFSTIRLLLLANLQSVEVLKLLCSPGDLPDLF